VGTQNCHNDISIMIRLALEVAHLNYHIYLGAAFPSKLLAVPALV
jgi:hypothetical protein